MCFNELGRFGQSDSCHCVAVGMNRMRGETHCHYSDNTLFPFFVSLWEWMFLSVASVSAAVSFLGILLHVLPCLVECVTFCCGLTKRVKNLSLVWQVRLQQHLGLCCYPSKSFWLIPCTVCHGFKEETQRDLWVYIPLVLWLSWCYVDSW